ncbi:NADH-dependent alcohol dehydrogenase [Propionigenium maris DSM 9537]|uniref:NADH-dependent alcohol dehydrogenase n=1 Tax=Propionigenium maris DSM 9537 TaxID=1123000 RepID=A0A9W6GIF7_9FUSO|nr:iron-containing alcohol dehydrogenase [Propionigenium maris]GLI54652.1 NADH-dependent alcohol dehydrogenase [Propionigenium maris DSM 9537]
MNFNLNLPTRVYFGQGSIKNMEGELKDYRKVMLLYGGGSIKRNGLYDEVIEVLKGAGKDFVEFGGIEPNPRYRSVLAASEVCVAEGVDLILAVGGGSVIDAAKAVALRSRHMEIDFWDLMRNPRYLEGAISVGTILTLAATGSETNCGFVLTNLKREEKLGHGNPNVYPKFAIMDPGYTKSVPRSHTRNGIVDTIAHLLEQYFTPLSDQDVLTDLMLERIERLIKNTMAVGPKLLGDLNNYSYREEHMYYAYMGLNGEIAGKVKRGDWASHGIEHALSAVYDIAHGAGLSIVFPHWMDYVVERKPERVKRMAVNIFEVEDKGSDLAIAREGIERFRKYLRRIEAPLTPRDEGIDQLDIDKVMHAAFARDSVLGHYVKLEEKDVRAIFESMK